ncbi:MAG: hypothetical protein FK730_13390 [Asgard group archaeon]|nr:hypothetical protein [Asgard group archaeon]
MKLNKILMGVFYTLIIFSTLTLSSVKSTVNEGANFELAAQSAPVIADHSVVNYVRFDLIPDANITNAKNTLHIAYGHTSHGSQIITGMNGLPTYKESNNGTEGLYDWNEGGTDGALDIDDYFMAGDLGNPDRVTWASRTEEYLDNPANSDVNVVMWSWCGQVSSASEADINTYLDLMDTLESDYPEVMFIYMTGHTDGSGLEGNLHIRNEQIRDYCLENNKILFDFGDIESYDPDGNYYGDKRCNDNCDYDSDGDDTLDANWAIQWQNDHPGEWYDCSSAHSQPLNANMKAYAAWWLWSTLTGWNTTIIPTNTPYTPSWSLGMSLFSLLALAVPTIILFSKYLAKRKNN